MVQYLRHKKHGAIYGYSEKLARKPFLEVVTEEEAFPEQFAPAGLKEKKAKVTLTTEPELIPVEPDNTDPALAADASRGL